MPQLHQEVKVLLEGSKAEGVTVASSAALEVQRVLTEMSGTKAEPSMPLPMVGFILEGHTHSIGSLAADQKKHQTDVLEALRSVTLAVKVNSRSPTLPWHWRRTLGF